MGDNITLLVVEMKKIPMINECYHCPLRSLRGYDSICSHIETKGNIIEKTHAIPEWCPLPEDD